MCDRMTGRGARRAPTQAMTDFVKQHLHEAAEILGRFDVDAIERTATLLADLRERGGRAFLPRGGGSAANCSHAVNDFRKICGIEAYAPTDNVSELAARTNDEGWPSVFVEWLKVSRLRENRGPSFVVHARGE